MYASERARVVYAGGVVVLFTRFDRFPWTEHWFLRGHLPPKSSRDSRTAVYGRNNNRNRVIYLIIDVIIARWKKRKKNVKKNVDKYARARYTMGITYRLIIETQYTEEQAWMDGFNIGWLEIIGRSYSTRIIFR